VQAAAALQAERMRRALEARAVVAQVAEQKEADRAALAAVQVSMAVISPFALSITDACIQSSIHLCVHSFNHAFILSFIQVDTIHVLQDQSTKVQWVFVNVRTKEAQPHNVKKVHKLCCILPFCMFVSLQPEHIQPCFAHKKPKPTPLPMWLLTASWTAC